MLLLRFTEDYNVIEVYQANLSDHGAQHIIHQTLEGARRIRQTERQPIPFV